MPIPKEKEKFTVQDYMTWNDGKRWELIDGVANDMTPAPHAPHQRVLGNFHAFLHQAMRGHPCNLWIAPRDVVLSEWDVVQPDLFVVCDPQKETGKFIQGAPDLIIEVLSPSTAKKDQWEKKNLYERHGVKEYLLVDPESQYARYYRLEADGRFGHSRVFGARETLPLHILDGLKVPLWEVFGAEPPEAGKK